MRVLPSRSVTLISSVTRASRRVGALLGVAVLVAGILQAPASASGTNPYINSGSTAATTGFDVSYPNCSATLPTGDYFAIVGLGGGRPFSTNSCAFAEWSTATTATTATSTGVTPSAYFNTGYAGAYANSILSTCSNAAPSAGVFGSASKHQLSQDEQAWAIGCSEALSASNYASGLNLSTPTMWWADIETGNSWSKNVNLNQFTLDGISYEMIQLESGFGGGFYSTPSMWASITGSRTWQTTPAASANWVAGPTSCSSSFDSSSTTSPVPTWLGQSGSVNGVDTDTAC